MNLRFLSCGVISISIWTCIILSSTSGLKLTDNTPLNLSPRPVPLIRKIPMLDDIDVSNDLMEEPSLLLEDEKQVSLQNQSTKNETRLVNDQKILSFFKNLWSDSKDSYKNVDEFLNSLKNKSKKVPLRADDGNCDRDLCHFTGRIRVVAGLTWTPELKNRLSHRFEAISSSLADMISSLLRGIHVEVSYLDITRIMSPFKTHVTVDFDVSFDRVQNISSADKLTKAFNNELFIGTNLGPYTLDPDETQFLLYNQQPYKNQRVHRLVDISNEPRQIVLNVKRPRVLSIPEPTVKVVENNYLLAGGVLSLISLIIFLGLGVYFQSKRTAKKSVNSMLGRHTIYSRIQRQHPHFIRYSAHDLSFFERMKIEDSEKSLMHSDSSSVTGSRNISLGESSSLRFDDIHRSTLKSNASSCNSSTRRKLDTIKEKESVATFEMQEISHGAIKKTNKDSSNGSELESQYDVIEKL